MTFKHNNYIGTIGIECGLDYIYLHDKRIIHITFIVYVYCGSITLWFIFAFPETAESKKKLRNDHACVF